MRAGAAPALADALIARARELGPTLRARARACEERRTLPLETVADLRAAGLFRLLQPSRFGGYELDLSALLAIARELARACPSTAWCLALFATHNRLVGLFDERAQQEVFGDTEEALVAAVFAPTGTATPCRRDGEAGFRVSGRWQFASGCDHGAWVAVAARVAGAEGGPIPDVRCLLVSAADCRIEDTWFAAGLRGTGSKDVLTEDVFVPAHRALSFLDIARGAPPGAAINTSPLFRLPIVPVLSLAVAGVALGTARGALEAFRDRARSSRTGLPGTLLAERAPSHIRFAEATAEIEAAALVTERAAEDLAGAAADGRLSPARHAHCRLSGAFAVRSCTQAVDRLFTAAGAGALFDTSPLQRAFRDLHAMSIHAALRFDDAAELMGRIEFGLAPTSPLI
jgi:3-hydroxy-9,10-secoandrosta-1,3,5(10)-triene-9,17-dione monooxygenase